MKLSVVFTLIALTVLIALLEQSDAGLLRRSRRLRRIGPPRHHNHPNRRNGGNNHRSGRLLRMGRMRWPSFLAPPRGYSEARSAGRRHPERREEFFRHAPHQHQQLRLPLMAAHSEPMLMSGSTQLNSWRPIDQGPTLIDRDPTYDYAPPSLERVKFSESKEPHSSQHPLKRKPKKPTRPEKEHMMRGKKPRPNAPPMFGRPIRRPSIWKLLATKQRRRPYPPPPQKHRRPPQQPFLRYPENGDEKEEAEIFPRIPNILYFQHADVLANAVNNHPRAPTRLQPVAHHPAPGAHHHSAPGGHHHHPTVGAPHQHPPAVHHNRPPVAAPQHPHPMAPHQHQHPHLPQNPVRNTPPMMHLPSSSTQLKPGMKPGMITNVPLYSHENQSPSLFNPVTPPMNSPPPTPSPPAAAAPIPQKPSDILYRPQEFMNPTRRPLNGPSILQPVQASTTPLTLAGGSTRNTAMKPVQPTQSLFDSVVNDPPKPIQLNSEYSILSSVNSVLGRINSNELTDDSVPLPVSPAVVEQKRPVFTTTTTTSTQKAPVSAENHNNDEEESTTIHVSTSVSHSTSFSIGTTESTSPPSTTSTSTTTTTEKPTTTKIPVTTTTTTTKTTTARYQRLPEMPTYKKRQPIYQPKRITPIRSSSSSSSVFHRTSQENKQVDPSSSEAIVVMSRSKVKNYKPQFLANYTQLLTFDKVEETAAELNNNNGPVSSVTVSPSFTKVTSNKPPAPVESSENAEEGLVSLNNSEDSESSSTTTKSPMENFDPMQLLHSWFQNT